MSKASVKITDDRIFYEAASREIYKVVQSKSDLIKSRSKPEISKLILQSLNDSETTRSLLAGKLRDDFGLFGNVVLVTLDNIVKHISENIDLTISKSKKSGVMLVIAVDILPGDFYKILSVPGASYNSRGGPVDWLEWLVTKGTQVVIGDYWLFPYAKGFTRSGGSSIMKKIESTPREPFRVDPNYAGTADDNFITRAIEMKADDILNAIALEIDRNIK